MVTTYVKLKIVKRPFRFWFPGTDVVREIVRRYNDVLDDMDFVVVSDKALCVAYGCVYDESRAYASYLDKLFTYVLRSLWSTVLRSLLAPYIAKELEETDLSLLARHKHVSGYVCRNILHVLKPVSECGIDATNLPYEYVSTPILNYKKVVEEIRLEIERRTGRRVNVLVIDSDHCFKPRRIAIALATRKSYVRGVIDLGVLAYILGHLFRKCFTAYPTPIAYDGIWIGLNPLLKIAKVAEKARGYGLGRTLSEMLRNLGKNTFDAIRWVDLAKYRHYPAIVVKITDTRSRNNLLIIE